MKNNNTYKKTNTFLQINVNVQRYIAQRMMPQQGTDEYTEERYIMIRCTEIPSKYLLSLQPKYTQEQYIIIGCNGIQSKYLPPLQPKCTQERNIIIGCTGSPSKYLLTLYPKYTQKRYIIMKNSLSMCLLYNLNIHKSGTS